VSKNYDLLSGTAGERHLPAKVNHSQIALAPPAVNRKVDEEIFKLIQRVFIGNGSGPPKLVVFAGIEAGCGCTWVCARAGETLARAVEIPVCMVDADQLSPGLHRYFGIEGKSLISEELALAGPLREQLTEISGKNLPSLTTFS
jgi:hypothetical protein